MFEDKKAQFGNPWISLKSQRYFGSTFWWQRTLIVDNPYDDRGVTNPNPVRRNPSNASDSGFSSDDLNHVEDLHLNRLFAQLNVIEEENEDNQQRRRNNMAVPKAAQTTSIAMFDGAPWGRSSSEGLRPLSVQWTWQWPTMDGTRPKRSARLLNVLSGDAMTWYINVCTFAAPTRWCPAAAAADNGSKPNLPEGNDPRALRGMLQRKPNAWMRL